MRCSPFVRALRPRRIRAIWLACCAISVLLLPNVFDCFPARAEEPTAPVSTLGEPITVAADWCCRWQQGNYEVWHLKGNVYINQGLTYARGPEAVLWIESRAANEPNRLVAYLEASEDDEVIIDDPSDREVQVGKETRRQSQPTWFKRMETTGELRMKLPKPVISPPAPPQIYQRGLAQFDPERQQKLLLAQYNEFLPPPVAVAPSATGMRRIEFFPRSDFPPDIKQSNLPTGEKAITVSGGMRLLVEGLPTTGVPAAFGPVGTVDITTDRAVIWTAGGELGFGGGQSFQSQDTPLEIYMEGNIEFRQGDRVVYAERMFYDVRRQVGVILNAELLTPLPKTKDFDYQGIVRLKAAAIRQLDAANFSATDALVTTSRLEEPSYHFGADEITFQDLQTQAFDPQTGAVVTDHRQLAESSGNFVYLSGIPVFYWPTIATDLRKPTFFVDNIRFGNDDVFGTQAMFDFDAYQLFGIRNAPAGTDWGLSFDYLSKRGFGHGTDFEYVRNDIFGYQGPARGIFDFWGIKDDGLDNLGRGRRDIVPEADYRFRLFGEHRQRLESGWDVTGELGWLSDRTFLEQYYEQEWDERRDARTGLRAKRLIDNRTLSIESNAQVNDFFTETEWLPRLDHYWLGQSLFNDTLTWYEHSQAAYARIHYFDFPTNPILASQIGPNLPWENLNGTDLDGERLVTRQELDLPFMIGGVKVVPFALGELAQWGEALDGDRLQRAYVHTGVRASVPFWSVFPDVQDPLFNLNGLSHKVVFEAEAAYADANANFTELPLYDPLDDTSIVEMLRRVQGGVLPPTVLGAKFDPRFYAFRSGIQRWVTSPTTEIADDLQYLRMGMRHRWQTKRGGVGRQHIVDWLTFDTNITYFPEADRDNFGAEMGLLDYDVRWHLGDRFTIVSDGAADFFGDGLRTVAGGVILNRPTKGNAFVGVRSIGGPIESNSLLASYSYRMSPKWISSAGAAFDFSDTGNIGQSLSVTRIGESLLVTSGVTFDSSKDNLGFIFAIEPRFLPKLNLTSRTGIEVPPAGAFGVE
jgi:hypothetical protein